jgi:NADH-quinone oxidoreductase subunit G
LARILGNLLLVKQMNGQDRTHHAGRVNNGLIPIWPHGNTQGALDMGVRPDAGPGYAALSDPGLDASAIYAGVASGEVKALYLAGADPVGDGLLEDRGQLDFLIVQELFLTESAKLADIVLPAQSWAEREGSYTNGERRIQRFYPAISTVGESRPDWQILAQIGERVGLGKPAFAASLIFREISQSVPQYASLDYRGLAWSEEQWPIVGGDDIYYGGTSYRNESGLGRQWPVAAETGDIDQFEVPEIEQTNLDGLVVISTAALYTPGTLLSKSELMAPRVAQPAVYLNAQDAIELAIVDGEVVSMTVDGKTISAKAHVNGATPAGIVLLRGAASHRALAPFVITKDQ